MINDHHTNILKFKRSTIPLIIITINKNNICISKIKLTITITMIIIIIIIILTIIATLIHMYIVHVIYLYNTQYIETKCSIQ